MTHDEFDHNAYYESEEPKPIFTDDNELKKEIIKLKRELKKQAELHEKEIKRLNKMNERVLINNEEWHVRNILSLREEIRELFEKNLELHETSKIFVKGLEHLKKDGIRVTQSHIWSRKGVHGSLEARVAQLAMDGKRVMSVCPMQVSHQGETMTALIVTEHFDKNKRSI
jgi:hypothetical protein